jgi:hypothetical protein
MSALEGRRRYRPRPNGSRPATDELLILTNDWDNGRGSPIFAVRALATAAD